MARLRMRRYEVRDGLPAVCMRCGADADFFVRRRFAWHPPWVAALLLTMCVMPLPGLVVWLVVSIALTRRMTVDAPLCHRHRRYWAWRTASIWSGLGAFVALGVASVALLASADDPRGVAYTVGAVGAGLAAFGGFAWLVAALLIQNSGMRPVKITDASITFIHLAPAFVDAFCDRQERLDDEYDARQAARRAARADDSD